MVVPLAQITRASNSLKLFQDILVRIHVSQTYEYFNLIGKDLYIFLPHYLATQVF